MAINKLNSISEILPEHVIETGGSRPVRLFCSDLNHYVCKYFTGAGPAYSLFNEYIAASFLKLWSLPVPDFAFVVVRRDHVQYSGLPYHYFNAPCFGSLALSLVKDVDKFFMSLPQFRKESDLALTDFLRIGLFDIWLSNEDRNFNNFNLLYDITGKRFVPIDHVQCFNGNNLDKGPSIITDNESVLSSPLIKQLFSRTLQTNLAGFRITLETEFRTNIDTCHANLQEIFRQLPDEWQLDIPSLSSRLNYLFTDTWISQCLSAFNFYFQQANNHKS